MTSLLQLLEGAAVAAAVYLLLGMAWNIVFTSCGYLNLAVGEFFVLAGVLAAKLPAWTGIHSPVVIVPVTVALISLLALVVERFLIRPLTDRELAPLIVLIGVALILAVGIDRLAPEVAVRSDAFAAGGPIAIGAVLVGRQDLIVVAVAVGTTIAVWLFGSRTDTGRTARACADARRSALDLGIPVATFETGAFVVAMAIAALAATVVTPIQGAAVGNGDMVALRAFLAVSLFGIGNQRGAVVGAILVATTEATITRYWSSDLQALVVLGVLLVLLVVQPDIARRTRPRRRAAT